MPNLLATSMSSFSNFLAFGGVFLVLISAYAGSDAADAVEFQYDAFLLQRMRELGIYSWQDLAKKSGLTRVRLRWVRKGSIAVLPVGQLTQLAKALGWSLDELVQNFGKLSTAKVVITTDTEEMEELRQQCARLREELQQQKNQLTQDFRGDTFAQLQTLLTNYPSARQMAEANSNLRAKNLTALFTPLDNLLESWGWELIGVPWARIPYDPQLHQPDNDDIKEGELVYIRFVGYRERDRILSPAKVSRTLPAGVKN
jgi:molecular chaperone GrpE (heat shock protein)